NTPGRSARQRAKAWQPGLFYVIRLPETWSVLRENSQSAATIAKPERVRRTLRAFDQGRMPESNDLHWSRIVTPRRARIHAALPRRVQSSRSGQSVDSGAQTSDYG